MSTLRNPIIKNKGVTGTEEYLQNLCDKTFLSLWSYPSVYRNQRIAHTSEGKELCDLLVVFGNDVIIFSDKLCAFPNTGDIALDWSRWYKRAVLQSAKQAWGAERWIREYPERIFLDRNCSTPFPFALPDKLQMNIHIVIVAHDASKRCRKEYGGSGSLMLHYSLPPNTPAKAFAISDLDKTKTFVHVFDDTTLDIILKTIDTVSDFIKYLTKKEKFLRSGIPILIAGEEELLALYLQNAGPDGDHDLTFDSKYGGIVLQEGGWMEFTNSPKRAAQIHANEVSYFWDYLIEKFSIHVLNDTEYNPMSSGFPLPSSEMVLRFMARESRIRRRLLSESFLLFLEKSGPNYVSRRFMMPSNPGDPHYVFLLYPRQPNVSEENYRSIRYNALFAYCASLKNRVPEATDIIGIATEPGIENMKRSEDALYLSAYEWTEENKKSTKDMMEYFGIPEELPPAQHKSYKVFPTANSEKPKGGNKTSRNELCPCGSGMKYKKCHGK